MTPKPPIADILEFRSNNDMHRPVISALELLKKYQGRTEGQLKHPDF